MKEEEDRMRIILHAFAYMYSNPLLIFDVRDTCEMSQIDNLGPVYMEGVCPD